MESFEISGYWWVPEHPKEKRYGTFSFDPYFGGKLEITFTESVNTGLGMQNSGKVQLFWGMRRTSLPLHCSKAHLSSQKEVLNPEILR